MGLSLLIRRPEGGDGTKEGRAGRQVEEGKGEGGGFVLDHRARWLRLIFFPKPAAVCATVSLGISPASTLGCH